MENLKILQNRVNLYPNLALKIIALPKNLTSEMNSIGSQVSTRSDNKALYSLAVLSCELTLTLYGLIRGGIILITDQGAPCCISSVRARALLLALKL